MQTTGAGGGGSSTSEAGGLQTVTVPLQTVSTGVKYTGQPVDEDGGADPGRPAGRRTIWASAHQHGQRRRSYAQHDPHAHRLEPRPYLYG